MALGFSLLTLEAIAMFAIGVIEALRLGRLVPLETLPSADPTESR